MFNHRMMDAVLAGDRLGSCFTSYTLLDNVQFELHTVLCHKKPRKLVSNFRGAVHNPASRFFYNRVKGELERELATLGFASLTQVRPGLIGGERDSVRAGEAALALVLGALAPVLPRRWRINPAENIAQALLEAAIAATPGVHVVASGQLS